MKFYTKRFLFWSSVAVFAYFVLYFSSVSATTHKARGPVTPEPAYFPSDGDFIRAVFSPAHFIDVMILRRSYWAPRLTSPNQALQATAAMSGSFTFDFSHKVVVAGASALPAAVPELR